MIKKVYGTEKQDEATVLNRLCRLFFDKLIAQLPSLFKSEREELHRIARLLDSVDDVAKKRLVGVTEETIDAVFEILQSYYKQKGKTLVVFAKDEIKLIAEVLKEYSKNSHNEEKKELVKSLLDFLKE